MKVFWSSTICIAALLLGSVCAYAVEINGGKVVPYLQNDAVSIQFVVTLLDQESSATDLEIEQFAGKLVHVLGQLSPSEQAEVWFGTPAS